jgi:tetratricopeptide (TPR) repeat protein
VFEILRSYFDITDLDSGQTARERIAGKLLLLDESFGEDLPLIFDFLGVPDPERPAPRLDPEVHQRRLLGLIKRLIRAQSAREPGVTVYEDLHWLDPATEVFLASHVEATQGTRGLTVLNFRPEYQAPWMSKSYYRQIPLTPLGPEAIDELLADLLGSDASLNGLPDLVRERTAGNPFFIEEVVRSLVEEGNLEGERGAYRLVRMVDTSAVPASVQAILSARIDRLGDREKAVLQGAAVIGKEFSVSTLSRVAELEDTALEEALAALVTGEFVYEQELYPEVVYAFTHPLTQEVAYASQLGERRAAAHAAVARAIAEQQSDRHDEFAALLAQHWESAGNALEAARWHARAGAWAGTKDPTGSMRHWRRVRELTDSLPESEETAALGLTARILSLNFGWRLGMATEEAEALFTEGERIASNANDLWSHALMLAAYGGIRAQNEGQMREYTGLARQALAVAEESGDPALYMTVVLASYAFLLVGEHDEGVAALDRAIELADGDPTLGAGISSDCPLAYCYVFKACFLSDMGRLEEARELVQRGMELAAEHGATETLGWGHGISGAIAFWTGEPDLQQVHAQQALDIAERIGDGLSRTWAWYWTGAAAMRQGRFEAAIDALERSRAISTERRAGVESEGWCLSDLAEARFGLGDAETAVRLSREAVAVMRERGQIGESTCSVVLARLLLASEGLSARDEIEASLARAHELVESTAYISLAPMIHVERAELARQNGDEEERQHQLREAHRLFTQYGATRHAERVAGELAALVH